MKLYSLRDRLLDYYHQAFIAPGDKEALVAVSNTINNGDPNNAISKTPHHFEVWRIGEIDDQANVTSSKEFLADASGLVRESIRKTGERGPEPGTGKGPEAPTSR